MAELLRGFDPVASSNATVIILGSMPGERSLTAAQYYAHPRNAFWTIMQEVVGVDANATYVERLRVLKAKGIALWDVLHSCHRQGSLDSAIRRGSIKVNDFNTFFREHPRIDDLSVAAQWLSKAFGFSERLVIGNHRVQLHAGVGSVVITAGGTNEESRGGTSVMVRVPDVISYFAQAKASGATIVSEPEDYPYGERQYTARDLAGHVWTFSQVSPT